MKYPFLFALAWMISGFIDIRYMYVLIKKYCETYMYIEFEEKYFPFKQRPLISEQRSIH